MGNFLTDYLTNKQVQALPAEWKAGVTLHRRIDEFTDQHPAVLEQVARMKPYHSRYAPVVVDVFYDYFLVKNWEKFAEEPFLEFCERVYTILLANLEPVPNIIRARIQSMVKAAWLSSYGQQAGILYAIQRMSDRTSKPEWLLRAGESFEAEYEALNQSFLAFFPELIQETECFC